MPDTEINRTNKDIWERLVRVETSAEIIYSDLKEIRLNDISHLDSKIDRNTEKIDSIEKKLAMFTGALAVLQILIPIVYRYIFNL